MPTEEFSGKEVIYLGFTSCGSLCVLREAGTHRFKQGLVNDGWNTILYDTVLTICGMPNRNGGSSTSDTGSAVIMRDGWSSAEARAKDTELMFKLSEKDFLKKVLRICQDLSDMELRLSEVEVRFTRRNYENIVEKANVLTTLLNNPKIAPQLAFTHCGMFSDPQLAYRMSMDYAKEQEKKALELAQKTASKEGNEGGDDDPDPKNDPAAE